MSKYKRGRKPARFSRHSMRSALAFAGAVAALGSPPAVCRPYAAAVKVPWEIFLNDKIGDCTCADTAHALMLRTANVGNIVVPSDADVEKLYEVFGYVPGNSSTDQGANESDVCQYLVSTGFLGHKADATAMLDAANHDYLKWCVQLFGHCRLGLNLPAYAEEQFENGQPWDVSALGDQSTDGHDVPLVDYHAGLFYCVTWGRLQPITPAFLDKYCEEAHAELFFDWAQAQGPLPSGFDLDALAAKLKQIAED